MSTVKLGKFTQQYGKNLWELSRMCELSIHSLSGVNGKTYNCVKNDCVNKAEYPNYAGITLSGLYCTFLTVNVIDPSFAYNQGCHAYMVPTWTRKPGTMGKHFPVREK